MTVEKFLQSYPRNLSEVAHYLRELVRSVFPVAVENVISGWKVIGYRLPHGKKSIYFCCIAPQKKENDVLLGFEYGVAMEDPKGIMEGKGTQVRFVRLHHTDEYAEEDLAWLIEEAARIAIDLRTRAF